MADYNRSTVVGVFQRRDQADCAMQGLRDAGFDDKHLGLAMRNEEGTEPGKGNKAGEGMLGGLIAAAASLLIPGVGPVIAGGVLTAALGGAAVGAAAGGLIGALTGMGVPEEEARYYDEQFRAGNVIVTVNAEGRYDEAYNIIHQCGGYDAQHRDNMRQEGYYGAQPGGYDTGTRQEMPERDEQTMRLKEEELHARKEDVQTGEVRVHKDVLTETQHLDVPVTREEVVVERRPVEGDQTARSDFGDQDIRIPVSEEQVRVEKRPVIREEVRVSKRPVEETEHISEEVRREQARVDRSGDAPVSGDDNLDDTNK